MVHIRVQHGVLAEGLVAADEHDKEHPHAGNAESQGQIIDREFFDLTQVHRAVLSKHRFFREAHIVGQKIRRSPQLPLCGVILIVYHFFPPR